MDRDEHDELQELIAESTRLNPDFSRLLDEARAERAALRVLQRAGRANRGMRSRITAKAAAKHLIRGHNAACG